MKITRALLRRCGRRVLESRGYTIKVVAGERIIPGTRLEAKKGSRITTVALRTSLLKRKLGFLRHPDGRWQTISTVDQVVVVARSLEDEMVLDVMCFDSRVLRPIFDKAASERRTDHHTHPLFLPLDEAGEHWEPAGGLKTQAVWHSTALIEEEPATAVTALISHTDFIERVKREFAALAGVDVSRVSVDFRITR